MCLLLVVAWVWPRLAIRGISLARRLDPGTPTVGEPYEEVIDVRRAGWAPAPWVEVRDLGQIPDYQPGRVISVGGDVVSWKTRGAYTRRARTTCRAAVPRRGDALELFNPDLRNA